MKSKRPAKREAGQGLVEYALIVTFVALAVITVLVLFGPALGRAFQTIVASFSGQGGAPAATQVAQSDGTGLPTAGGVFGTPLVTDTPEASSTPSPTGTASPTATPTATGTSTAAPSSSPTASATAAPSDTSAPTSTTAPSSTARPAGPSSTPVPTNTPPPTLTPVPSNTAPPPNTATQRPAPSSTPVPPTNTPVPTSTAVPPSTATNRPPAATPLTGVIASASAARKGGGSGNALDVTITVNTPTTVTLVDSVGGTLASKTACSGTCVIHIGSIGKNAGYIAITAAAGGVLTVWYPAKG